MELSGIRKLKIVKSCLVRSGDINLHYFSSDFSDIDIYNRKVDFPRIPKLKYFDKKIPDTIQHSVITNINDKELFNEINNLKSMNAGKVQLMNIELEKHSFSVWTAILIVISISAVLYFSFKLYKYLKLKFGKGGDAITPTAPTNETQ